MIKQILKKKNPKKHSTGSAMKSSIKHLIQP